MANDAATQAAWGRIGGLTAWARNDVETMVGPARRGFARRFERLVDPDGLLDPQQRSIRADRARRAHMLTLAARSAEVRRKRKAVPAIVVSPGTATLEGHGDDRPAA